HILPSAFHAVPRVEEMDDARYARLGRPAPRIAGQSNGAGGAAMVRAVAREYLVSARVLTRQLDRVLVRLRAAVGEEEDVDVTGGDPGESRTELRPRLGRHERIRVGERCRLLLDRLDDALVPVADVHAHQLAVEVEIALAVGG